MPSIGQRLPFSYRPIRPSAAIMQLLAATTSARREDLLNHVTLQNLRKLSPAVDLAILIDPEGAILASSPEIDEGNPLGEIAAPMLTALAGLAERTTRELGRGLLQEFILRGPAGHVVARDLGDGRILAIVARPSAQLGLLLDDIDAAADTLTRSAA
ncbi:MAG: hypothetical protein EA397_13775 [Deltaproteobacteria bacterium]|nr:MAG: hypothetical protein EA397_13775 [Deltaproteobacteria bacterium]